MSPMMTRPAGGGKGGAAAVNPHNGVVQGGGSPASSGKGGGVPQGGASPGKGGGGMPPDANMGNMFSQVMQGGGAAPTPAGPNPRQPVAEQPVGTQPNGFEQGLNSMNQGMDWFSNAMNYQAPTLDGNYGFNASTYDPASYQASQSAGLDSAGLLGQLGNANALRYSANTMQAPGKDLYSYDPTLAQAQSYSAAQLRDQNIQDYMNPYTNSVIDSAMNDLDRGRQQALNSTGAAATAGGAFGGDRHGIMEAQNNRDYMDQVARTSSNLRNQAYMNAQNAALGDVNAMNQQRATNAGMAQQAGLANQAAQNARDQFVGATANQNYMQSNLANMQAQNAAAAQNAQLGTQANMQNMANKNAFLSQLAGLQQSNNQFNASALNSANQFNAGSQNAANQFNSAAQNAANQFNSQMGFNTDAFNAQQAQQQFQNQANAANTLYGMGNDRYNMTDQALGNMGQLGQYVDQLNNQYLQQGMNMFDQNANWAQNQFQYALGPLGSMQGGQTQTYNPGKMDYLGMGTQLGAAAIMKSDAGLKDNLKPVAKINGFQLYTWEWNERAVELGCSNDPTFGVVAQEVRETRPEAVLEHPDGYLMVDYRKLPEIARTVAMGGR